MVTVTSLESKPCPSYCCCLSTWFGSNQFVLPCTLTSDCPNQRINSFYSDFVVSSALITHACILTIKPQQNSKSNVKVQWAESESTYLLELITRLKTGTGLYILNTLCFNHYWETRYSDSSTRVYHYLARIYHHHLCCIEKTAENHLSRVMPNT